MSDVLLSSTSPRLHADVVSQRFLSEQVFRCFQVLQKCHPCQFLYTSFGQRCSVVWIVISRCHSSADFFSPFEIFMVHFYHFWSFQRRKNDLKAQTQTTPQQQYKAYKIKFFFIVQILAILFAYLSFNLRRPIICQIFGYSLFWSWRGYESATKWSFFNHFRLESVLGSQRLWKCDEVNDSKASTDIRSRQ